MRLPILKTSGVLPLSILCLMVTLGATQASSQEESSLASIGAALERAYSRVTPRQVPSGILLERGAVFGRDAILQTDGNVETAKALSAAEFGTLYMDLRRGSLEVDLPSPEALNADARRWREDVGATPISLAIIEYTTLSNGPAPPLVEGVFTVPEGVLGEERHFVGSQVLADTVYGWAPSFVVPSDLLVLNGIDRESIEDLAVQIGEAPAQAVDWDRPFVPEWLPSHSGPLEFSISARVNGRDLITRGIVSFITPQEQPTNSLPAVPLVPPGGTTIQTVPCTLGQWFAQDEAGTKRVRFWDIRRPTVGAPFFAPWNEPFQTSSSGRLNIRVIPANGDAVRHIPGTGQECEVQLRHPVVLVDGIDIFNTRTQDTILDLFGPTIKKLNTLGFDVITVDYQNGRDWIERNGRALRQFMTTDIKDLVPPDVLKPGSVAVVAGSMGTQVTRWALLEAEAMAIEHHAGLFLSLDGPFLGGNIPIGFQYGAVDLAPLLDEAAKFKVALESPAASELLLRTFPRGADTSGPGWYTPRPENPLFYGAAAALGGLPRSTRNVSGVNGSGLGTPQTNLGRDVRLLKVEDQPLLVGSLLTGDFSLEVRSDGPGSRVYHRRLCFTVFGLVQQCSSTPRFASGIGLDTAPGGTRFTTADFVGAVGSSFSVGNFSFKPDISFDLDHHAFIPTTSALGSVSWDERTWEKCNTPHVYPTPTLVSLVLSEVLSFRQGVTPDPVPRFATGCGIPEPRENCFPGVLWYADPDAPTYLRPWDNGAACYVTPYPSQLAARVVGRRYTVVPDGLSCFDGGPPQGTDCPFTTVSGGNGVDFISIPTAGLLHVTVIGNGGPSHCPSDTSFLRVHELNPGPEEIVECEFLPTSGVSIPELFVSGLTVMAPADAVCSIGEPRRIGSEWLCYLGTAPAGTRPFEHDGAFYYDGWD